MFGVFFKVADETPLPLVIGANLTMPWWRDWLATLSEGATLFAQIVALALAIYKGWQAYKEHKGHADAASGIATAVGAAAKKGSVASGSLTAIVLAFLGVFAIGSWLASSKANALPVTTGAKTVAAKRKPNDDAGDEGEAYDTQQDKDPPWLKEAFKLVGEQEAKGRGSNPVIVQLFAEAGHPEVKNARTVPWCAAFVGAMLKRANYPGTNSLMARSFRRWGEEIDTPVRGCVCVIWRGAYDDSETGHVFFWLREDYRYVYGIGGNQGDSVSVAKFPKNRILGYYMPKKASSSRTIIATGVSAAAGATGTAAGVADVIAPVSPAPPLPKELTPTVIDSVQGPLEKLSHALPSGSRAAMVVAILCMSVAVAGALYAAYRHSQHYRA